MKAIYFNLLVVMAMGAAVLLPTDFARAQGVPTIEAIAVEGAARVDAETVRSYLTVREGDAFDPVRIDRSLKSLFATGLFADVSLRREGDILVIVVVENPVINRIAFEGNQRIDDEELSSEIGLKPRVIYTRSKVQNDVNRIQTLYQKSGRFSVTVEPKLIQLPQNRVDLVFEVDEGALTEVQNIRFVGNRVFDDGDLQEIIRTRETRWYRFLSSDDTYDPDRITFDRELLRRYYLKNGYADFKVLSAVAELTPSRDQFFITFTVEEGRRYTFGDISIQADLRDMKADDVSETIAIEKGEWYDADLVDDTVQSLTDAAGNLGYAFVDVRPKVDRDSEAGVINLDFEIKEGPRVFVERINITGNVRTHDNVIRREFNVVEGDAFNSAKLRKSITNIEDLDFFERVDVKQVQGSAPDKAVVNVEVEEKSTGSLSIGAGYSTTNGALAEFGIRERNLLGKGQELSFNSTISQRQTLLNLGFTEPHFLNRDISAGFNIFSTETDNQSSSSYDTEDKGFALRFGYPISTNLSQGWVYTLKSSSVTNVPSDASIYVQEQAGDKTLSELSHSIAYDRRNSKIRPTEGYVAKLTNDLSGLGGDSRYLRNTVRGAYYYKIADGWITTLKGKTGVIVGIGEDVGLLDRYYIGGDDLRGFENNGIGPRDISTSDALGGEFMYTGTAELAVPLGLPQELGISGKLFTDFGSLMNVDASGVNVADEGSIRSSVGAGLTWVSPVGPISLDFAQAVVKESYDQTEFFRFNFGTKF
ncbi:outer membrane protein assembly factor BamA [Magnetovibrio sp. PR-2]|uniref:outer membrane protein assembly factor BamA n=1 Tax=Magnetovibrio sp. PR-2 TaxID=3120356 RepID=UPI002FCE3CA6